MTLPDLTSTLEAQNLTTADLAARLGTSETEVREVIRGEANGEIHLGELRDAYAALGKEVIIVVADPMVPEVQEKTREECWRRLQVIRDYGRPPLPPGSPVARGRRHHERGERLKLWHR